LRKSLNVIAKVYSTLFIIHQTRLWTLRHMQHRSDRMHKHSFAKLSCSIGDETGIFSIDLCTSTNLYIVRYFSLNINNKTNCNALNESTSVCITRSSAVAKRPRDASCLSVSVCLRCVNSTIPRAQFFLVERPALAVRLDLCFRSVYFFIREYLPNR